MGTPYAAREVVPGILHIWDPMGVGMTLLQGSEQGLLLDAGYGLWDLPEHVRTLCGKPVTLLLSHVHHDHMLGAMRFAGKALMHAADLPLRETYAAPEWRRNILAAARESGPEPDAWARDRYLRAPAPEIDPLPSLRFDLGGLTVRVLPLPGHTPGSIGLLAEECGVLLLADSWNPQTWLFFPECCSPETYRESLRSLKGLSFERVLVSHDPLPRPAAALRRFIDGLTDETLDGAADHPVAGHEGVPTCRCEPSPGSPLIFDRRKWRAD